MTHDEYLAHFGILGMKWGRKKDKQTGQTKKRKSKKEQQEELSQLSDKELRDRINRLQMEKQYSQLTSKDKSAGAKFVTDVLRDASKEVAKDYTKKYMKKGINALGGLVTDVVSLPKISVDLGDDWG